MATAAFAGVRFVPTAHASYSHNGWDQKHIATIHDNNGPAGGGSGPGTYDEEYCVMSETSAMPVSTIGPFIQQTLTQLSFDIVWDGSADWRVDLWRAPKACNEYSTADRNNIEIEYRIRETWASVCGGDIYACVTSVSPITDATRAHQHYKYMNVHLKREQLAALATTHRARKFINHETGHVLGLRDPVSGAECMYSVMTNDLYAHLGCTATVWHPTTSDFVSVRSIANRAN
ncbi:hypothetical protein HPC49_31695 [Pyxidicoccus fallax]|uniref:Uncharacterized protein n=2 Tax=Pyxidicoccus fallax TaxID=394095 RepID=A0A848LU12_9BACT|nr:hypothetical protein [Pyxidicoccus fallax]NPC82774.1 hypothetical protein [Pyxidicoccus fallax]